MAARDFLRSVFSSRLHDGQVGTIPFVTLTFAQSLDGKIAGKGGKQLLLSGPESMLMTHWMRSMHEAILVGIGTALNDDPQLNTRLLPEDLRSQSLPQPIILDAYLRFRTDCKLLGNFHRGTGLQPWIFCSSTDTPGMNDRKLALIEAGALVFCVSCQDGLLSIPQVLRELYNRGIKSLMVEGGATVINSFLKCAYQSSGEPIIDTLIITTAPTLVGDEGVGYKVGFSGGQRSALTQHIRSEVMGKDTVVAIKLAPLPHIE